MNQLNHVGRLKIYTDVKEITYKNVIDVLRKAYGKHLTNVADMNYLIDYEAGEQPLMREKKTRPEIDCVCIDNLAHYIVEFHLAFDWQNPITIVQRGIKDSGKKEEPEGISLLNENYAIDGNAKKMLEVGWYVERTGLGFTYEDAVKEIDYEEGDSYFNTSVLDPRCTFVVYSSAYIDKRPMMGVTYRHDNETGNNYFTVFTKEWRYEIVNLIEIINGEKTEEWLHKSKSGEKNPLNKLPIVEWTRSNDRTCAFEHLLDQLDYYNLLLSDYGNSVEEVVQSIWHVNDVEFEEDENGNPVTKPKPNSWFQTFTTQDGRTPIVEPLSVNYDYSGQLANINATRARILEEANVPNRDTTSGGSTGVAADTITGYEAAESAAVKKQALIEDAKMKQVEVDLACLKISSAINIDNPMLLLTKKDCQVSIKRQKNYELTTKANFFATMVSHGIHGLHAIQAMNTFGDPNQVYEDSKELIEAYQNSIFKKDNQAEGGEGEQKPNKDRLEQDLSDQVTNSPNIDGMTTNQEV